MQIDFESVTIDDKKNVFNQIENINKLSLEEIKEKLMDISLKILANTKDEKEVYIYLTLLIEYNLIDVIKYNEISESTLKVLIKDLNIKNLFSLNSLYHTRKLISFENFLNNDNEESKINMLNTWLDLNNQIIHIDNVMALQKKYKFKYVDAIVIVDNISKVFKESKYSEDEIIFSSSSSLYCFCKSVNDCDYLDFSMSKSESNSKFRFFINSIYSNKKSFKLNQELAYKVYEKILNNSNFTSKNEIFNLKLNIYNPKYCSNVGNRSIHYNYLEN